MLRRACVVTLLIAFAARADDATDRIDAKLDKALAAYQTEMKTYREKGNAWLATQETAARAAGDKKRLDKAREESRVFRVVSELPAQAPTDLRKRPGLAREKLLLAYAAGVKDATKAGKDKLAAEFEQDAARIKSGVDPSLDRRQFVHPTGEYCTNGKGVWVETAPDGGRLTFREVDRTPEYVEIITTIGARTIDVRLTNAGAFYRDRVSGEHNLEYRGRWWVWGDPKPEF
jgi:hypothetical protein